MLLNYPNFDCCMMLDDIPAVILIDEVASPEIPWVYGLPSSLEGRFFLFSFS